MTKRPVVPSDPAVFIPQLPRWIMTATAETLEAAAFRSGAALAHLHLVTGNSTVPQALWRARLALSAAESCVRIMGRREGVVALRDAVHLIRPGDSPGPAGEILRQWFRAVSRSVQAAPLARVLEGLSVEKIAACFDGAVGNPVDRAVSVLESMLVEMPRAETAALILTDAALAKALGWDPLVPLLSLGLKPRDLRLRGDDLHLASHRAVTTASGQAVTLAADLTRLATRLRAVVPQLRAKGAGKAVDLFLSHDALAPGALTGLMSDRAARRLCDRLVDLDVVRELTGRDSFRQYGV